MCEGERWSQLTHTHTTVGGASADLASLHFLRQLRPLRPLDPGALTWDQAEETELAPGSAGRPAQPRSAAAPPAGVILKTAAGLAQRGPQMCSEIIFSRFGRVVMRERRLKFRVSAKALSAQSGCFYWHPAASNPRPLTSAPLAENLLTFLSRGAARTPPPPTGTLDPLTCAAAG